AARHSAHAGDHPTHRTTATATQHSEDATEPTHTTTAATAQQPTKEAGSSTSGESPTTEASCGPAASGS
ncbi:MAG TPA: hypothetical protein VJA25_04670, partial [Dehalococcoidia bacterium]|nr:hypothetical protein [Dehalococcoidia bacterium]